MRPILASLCFLAALGCSAAAQQRLQSVRGVVKDAAGAPLEGADVQLGQRRTTTNAQGVFRVDSLKPGNYPITIRRVGYSAVRSRIAVAAAEPTELEFILQKGPVLLPTLTVESHRTGIYGSVGDTAYRPAVGAKVQVVGNQGGEAATDSMGRFAFPKADQGAYMVRVTFPGYSERRFALELKHGEGREVAVFLTPVVGVQPNDDPGAVIDLGKRLAFGLARDIMTPGDLVRYGSEGICDIPRIKAELGTRSTATTTLILNGTTVISEFPIGSLCNWQADEVDLVEFGSDVCRDVTHTIGELVSAWCSGRTRNVTRSIAGSGARVGTQRGGSSYIILWEKK